MTREGKLSCLQEPPFPKPDESSQHASILLCNVQVNILPHLCRFFKGLRSLRFNHQNPVLTSFLSFGRYRLRFGRIDPHSAIWRQADVFFLTETRVNFNQAIRVAPPYDGELHSYRRES